MLPLADAGQAVVALPFDPNRPLPEVVEEVEGFAAAVAGEGPRRAVRRR